MADRTSSKREHNQLFVQQDEQEYDALGIKRLKLDIDGAIPESESFIMVKSESQEGLPDRGVETPTTTEDTHQGKSMMELSHKVPSGRVQPYRLVQEKKPMLPTFCPSFEKAEKLGAETLRMFIDLIETKFRDLVEVAEFRLSLKDALALKYPDAKLVGMIGSAGVGKSSLTNCVFNSNEYATKGSSGKSTTYVPHEYRTALPGQKESFVSDICFYGEDERDKHLEAHLANYFRFFVDPPPDDELDVDSHFEAETALKVFRTLFAKRPAFRTDTAAKKFLSFAKSDADPEILAKLQEYTRELMSDDKIKRNELRVCDGEMQYLNRRLRQYTRDPPPGEDPTKFRSVWPLVKTIRIYSKNEVLEHGVTIVDLPGTSDSNQIRASSATNYAHDCDVIILVTPIHRIVDDLDTNQNLSRYSCNGAVQCVLVATMSDERLDDAAGALPEMDQDVVSQYEDKIESLETERGNLKEEAEDLDGEEKTRIREKIDLLKFNIDELRNRKDAMVVAGRNSMVKRTMIEKYKSITGDSGYEIPVFCVSNKIYGYHMKGYCKDKPLTLTLEETQIPAFRRFLYSLPSTSRFKTLSNWCRHTIPSLITAAKVLCTKSRIERREQLEAILSQLHDLFDGVIERLCSAVRTFCDNEILSTIKLKEDEFCAAAKKVAEDRAELHWSTFLAFCKHEGNRQISSKGKGKSRASKSTKVSWNEEMLKPVSNDVAPLFKKLLPYLRNLRKELVPKIDKIYEKVRLEMREKVETLISAISVFFETLDKEKGSSQQTMRKEIKRLQKDLNAIGSKVYTNKDNKQGTSYFNMAMKDVYKQCTAMTGLNSDIKRKEYFESCVSTSGGVFNTVIQVAEGDISAAIEEFKKRLTQKFSKQTAELHKTFDRMFGEKEMENEEVQKLNEELQKLIPEAERVTRGPLEQELQECENFAADFSGDDSEDK